MASGDDYCAGDREVRGGGLHARHVDRAEQQQHLEHELGRLDQCEHAGRPRDHTAQAAVEPGIGGFAAGRRRRHDEEEDDAAQGHRLRGIGHAAQHDIEEAEDSDEEVHV